jgi:branched-chain amino acid transport system permease protein
MFLLGVGIQLVFLRPLRDDDARPTSPPRVRSRSGSRRARSVYRSTITGYADRSWVVGGYHFSESRVFAFAASLGVVAILFAILERTKLGRAIRATVQNPTSARLLGVDTRMVSALGFGLSVATASAAGAVYGSSSRSTRVATTT